MADNSTQSNYQLVRTLHYSLALSVDWQARSLTGAITHSLRALTAVSTVVLDTSYLSIQHCEVDGASASWTLGTRNANMGQALRVELGRELKAGELVTVLVRYSTTKECTALGWLNPSSTASGRYPFFYSQNQAIHCRSMAPVQDTPAVKSSWDAAVQSELPILMSGLRLAPPLDAEFPIGDGVIREYTYKQTVPVPSYLLAIAGGELVFASLGERTGVWTEPSNLEPATREFSRDAERYLAAAEHLTTPYKWGRYDVLLLPASFPYGGMENPNLTFLTPALITGDRSETDTIAHEQAHSWFGNSIGCSSWDSFWLNEGWTTYLERLIINEVHGPASRDFAYIIGAKAMYDSLERFESSHQPGYQRLHISYSPGQDPDDGFSSIPYDKGSQLLYLLEKTVGGLEFFLPYVKAYVVRFTGESISTADWLAHLWEYWNQFPVKVEALRKVKWDAWLYGEGVTLPDQLVFDTSLADASYSLAARWDAARTLPTLEEFSPSDIKDFSSKQVSLFLETIEVMPKFKHREISKLGEVYRASFDGNNSEIKVRWFAVALKAGFLAPEAALWVQTQGRMKYCRPIYAAINRIDSSLARATFIKSRSFYHPIAARLIAKDLGLE